MKSIALSILILLSLHCFSQNKEVTNWINTHAVPINTSNYDFDEIQGIGKYVQHATIVGVGEASHGSHENFIIKNKLVKYLIAKQGYRLFAMEADFADRNTINNYIVNKGGSMKECISSFWTWPWATEEMAELIEWMKNFNLTQPENRKIQFYGFDMQSVRNPVKMAKTFLKNKNELNKTRESLLDSILTYNSKKKTEKVLISGIGQLIAELQNNKKELLKTTSVEDFNFNVHTIETIKQWIKVNALDELPGYYLRDQMMLENVEWIKKNHPNQKLILWAHDGHLRKEEYKTAGYKPLGYLVKQKYNEKYYIIGFDFGRGTMKASGVKNGVTTVTIDSLDKKMSSRYFEKSKFKNYFIDLNSNRDKKDKYVEAFLNNKIDKWSIGAVYDFGKEKYSYAVDSAIVISKSYNAICYIDRTSASKSYNKMAYISQDIDVKEYRNLEFRMTCDLKVPNLNNDAMVSNCIYSASDTKPWKEVTCTGPESAVLNQWLKHTTSGKIDADSNKFTLGYSLTGTKPSEVFIDNIVFEVLKDGKWLKINLKNSDFDNGVTGQKPDGYTVYENDYSARTIQLNNKLLRIGN
jgi:erythromycin esterase